MLPPEILPAVTMLPTADKFTPAITLPVADNNPPVLMLPPVMLPVATMVWPAVMVLLLMEPLPPSALLTFK